MGRVTGCSLTVKTEPSDWLMRFPCSAVRTKRPRQPVSCFIRSNFSATMRLRQRNFPPTSLVFQLKLAKGPLFGVVGIRSYLWWSLESLKRLVGASVVRRLIPPRACRTVSEVLDPAARRGLSTRHLISKIVPHDAFLRVLERHEPTRALCELLRTNDLWVTTKRGRQRFVLKGVEDPTLPGALPFYRWIRNTLFGRETRSPDVDSVTRSSRYWAPPDPIREGTSTSSDSSGYIPRWSEEDAPKSPPGSTGYSPCSPAYEYPPEWEGVEDPHSLPRSLSTSPPSPPRGSGEPADLDRIH